MVSAAFSDALFNPTRVLEHLYTAHDGPMDGFASHVAKHFREVFDTKDAFQQVRNPRYRSILRLIFYSSRYLHYL